METINDIVFEIPKPENAPNPNVCFVMICRDEEPVIERALNSVVNFFDCFVICDTGSKDNTIQVIKNFMQKNNKYGYILFKEWKNFGYNKSYLLKRAYSDNLSHNTKYICWSDCDECIFNGKGEPLTKSDAKNLLELLDSHPETGIFYLKTHFGNLKYWRWNIVRNNQLYIWKGSCQELLESTTPTGHFYIPDSQFYLLARKEGNSARNPARKFNDVKMLKEWTEEEPDSGRAMFYYGDSLLTIGLTDKAKEAFIKRMELNGYQEEIYIACLKIARHCTTDFAEKDKYLSKAANEFPQRLEAFYELLMLHKDKNMFLAFEWATKAPENVPDNSLFMEHDIIDWKFYLEASAVAWNVKEFSWAYHWHMKLKQKNKWPENHNNLIKTNEMFILRDFINVLKTPPKPKDLPNDLVKITPTNNTFTRNNSIPSLIVIDNFFDNPDEVRDIALNSPFPVRGNYPGARTLANPTEAMKLKFENIIGRRITYWPTDKHSYNGSFQFATKDHKSWIHRDLTDYSAIIYLTPNAPLNTGTTTYRHKETKLFFETPETKNKLNNDGNNYSLWDIVDSVANVYNRCVIFNGKRSHMSTDYFGTDLYSGRLFQTYFFNVELSPEEQWKLNSDKPM